MPGYCPGLSCKKGSLLAVVSVYYDQGKPPNGESLPLIYIEVGGLYSPRLPISRVGRVESVCEGPPVGVLQVEITAYAQATHFLSDLIVDLSVVDLPVGVSPHGCLLDLLMKKLLSLRTRSPQVWSL